MTIRLGVIMDPIQTINYKKDSTLAMLWEAQSRGWEIYYFEQQDLFLKNGAAFGSTRLLTVFQDEKKWFEFGPSKVVPLVDLQVMLMRKDPPVDETYIYTTQILDHAERQGVFVVNKPQSLRDCNEKLFATHFPTCTPPTVVAQTKKELFAFWREYKDIVCKPLNAMGGASIYRLKADEVNANVIFDTLTHHETQFAMAQQFIPDIKQGDKRILMINGEPVSHVLARVPHANDWRGNLAAGASGVVQPLSAKDRWISEQVSPILRDRGLYFVGLDVIGNYLTEINVTSPTCIREIDAGAGMNISKVLMDFIQQKIKN